MANQYSKVNLFIEENVDFNESNLSDKLTEALARVLVERASINGISIDSLIEAVEADFNAQEEL